MKTKKIMTAIFVGALAVAFSSCKTTNTPDVTTTKAGFKVYYVDADSNAVEVKDSATVNVTEVEAGPQLAIHGYVYNATTADYKILVDATRSFSATEATDQFCGNECVPGNEETNQTFVVSTGLTADNSQTFYADVYPNEGEYGTYTVSYKFYNADKTSEYIVLTVNYIYQE